MVVGLAFLFIGLVIFIALIDIMMWIYGISCMFENDIVMGIIFVIGAFLFLGLVVFLIELIMIYWA